MNDLRSGDIAYAEYTKRNSEGQSREGKGGDWEEGIEIQHLGRGSMDEKSGLACHILEMNNFTDYIL